MRKERILIAVSLLAALAGKAQSGTITGKVEDPSQKPMEAVTATLVRAKDTGVVKIELTDKTGVYLFNGVTKGAYRVMLTGSGYSKQFTNVVEVTEKSAHDLGKVSLTPETKNLKEITVTARKPFIEQKIDKMVVNVDAAVTNAGTNVLEVLEKSPGITVDGDGKISLKGKQQVMVMIDGKPTYLGQAELTNLLKTMPSSSVEQIEIMTNPSAKYDAAGNSGIINLRTKKNKQYGFNGSVNANYSQGKYWRTNDNMNLNYRNGKLNVFANGGYSKWNSFQNLDIKRTFKDPNDPKQINAIFEQQSRMRSMEDNFNMKLGADYYLSKKTTVGFVSTGLINPENFWSNNKSYLMDANGNTDSIVLAESQTKNKWKNGTLNLNFRHQFDSTGREITADLDYARYSSAGNQSFETSTLTPDMSTVLNDEKLRGYLPVNIDIYAAKVDYVQNVFKGKIETGLKSSFVTTKNAANYYEVKDQGESVDYGKTNMFDYQENIYAAYINYSRQFKKFGVQAGLRYEYTQMQGDQYGNPTRPDSSFSRDYGSLFPTVFISYNASKNHTWGFNIGRRIDRPAYQDLNPFLFFIDPYTYQSGNPFLRPQFTNNIEVSHTFKGFLTTTVNYSHTKDFHTETFEQAKLPNGDDGYATIVRRGNIGQRDNAGIAVSAQVPVKKWWTAVLYTNFSYSKFDGMVNNEAVNVEAATLMANINNQFKFNKGWSAELSGFWRSKGAEGQILINPLGQVSAGVSKQVLKGKGTVKMNIRDMFYTQVVSGNINFQNTEAWFKNARDSRVATLGFTYRFGKPIKGAPQRKTGGAKDEQSRVKMGEN